MTDAYVRLWGKDIGAVSWLNDRQIGVFQYEPSFAASGIQLAPLTMPLSTDPYEFPSLSKDAFKGLPGLLADSLPDKFGNALIDAWLAQQGRSAASFNPVERLCYIGTRGMGALEFHPAIAAGQKGSRPVEVEALVNLANLVLNNRERLAGVLTGDDDRETLQDILRVGTSAGGARAKAVLAWSPETGEFRSGQLKAGEGFTYWLMKFDGISNNKDKELADPQGFGRIEYSFYLLAKAAGIDMTECRLHHEGGRSHFMTRRFDRSETGQKIHMQSLAAMRHYDFNAAGAYSYEQAIETIRMIGLPQYDIEQQFRRTVLNILIRNQDDHVKNIGFLMNRKGEWRLSPAFDVCYAYNPSGPWTSTHQMSLNGKRDDFSLEDLLSFGEFCGLKRAAADKTIRELHDVMGTWSRLATEAGVDVKSVERIGKSMRREIVAPLPAPITTHTSADEKQKYPRISAAEFVLIVYTALYFGSAKRIDPTHLMADFEALGLPIENMAAFNVRLKRLNHEGNAARIHWLAGAKQSPIKLTAEGVSYYQNLLAGHDTFLIDQRDLDAFLLKLETRFPGVTELANELRSRE